MEIVNFIITPNTAVANGADEISASAVIMNGRDYVSNEPVVFTITTGLAIFSNGLSSITVSSDSLGAVSASLVDTTAENIVVEIALQSEAAIHASQAATFTASDNNVDTISLLLTIDDARADGEDQNQVELQTLSGAIPVASTAVSVALTNGAVFISGDKTAKIKTDSKGRASLPFTSTTSGESKLTAYISDNIAVYNSLTATFVSASPKIGLVLDVVSDNAQANGSAVNRVRATVTDRDTQKPLSGQAVTFTITSGSAVFDNDRISYSATTDGNGEAYASVKDNAVETVTLSAVTGDKTANTTIHFSRDYAPLEINRVYNVNQTFLNGKPTVAWNGAELSVYASGGSGDYIWSVTDGSDVLSISASGDHSAVFIFKADGTQDAKKKYNVRVADNVSAQTADYTFTVELYFTAFGSWEVYDHRSKYPSTDELVLLYNEWGDMRRYGEWFQGGDGGVHYWTSDLNFFNADAVNLSNGSVDRYSYILNQCGFARKG